MLASICLRIFHFVYSLTMSISNIWNYFHPQRPLPLTAARTKMPSHLALLLVTNETIDLETIETTITENVTRTVDWCRAVGIKELTVYDAEGLALSCLPQIRACLVADLPPCQDDTDSEVEYPLTPPLSETSGSRPMSPILEVQLGLVTMQVSELRAPKLSKTRHNVLKRRRQQDCNRASIPLALNFVSRESSKPTIASIARSYTRNSMPPKVNWSSSRPLFELSPEELGAVLEGQNGLKPPNFTIVHHICPSRDSGAPLELYGFPPWQLQLTEIYLNSYKSTCNWFSGLKPGILLEEDFRAALDDYAGAEMRLGK